MAACTGALALIGLSGTFGDASAQTYIDSNEVVTGGAGGTQPNPWAVESSAYIGHASEGSLTVENGGAAHFENWLTVGDGSAGSLIVRGAGSELTGDGDLWVGTSSDGSLTIEDGASANFAGYVNFGYTFSSSGLTAVTVDGADTSLSTPYGIGVQSNYRDDWGNVTNPNHITTFEITNGASVESQYSSIATSAQSFAIVTVSGAGSSWASTNHFSIGDFGTGVLKILDGAVVTSTQTDHWIGSSLGTNSGGHGEALVDGAGSKWEMAQDLSIGRTGTGILTIANGGTVITDDGDGTVLIGNETANARGTLNIGAAAGEDAVAPGTLQAGKIQFGLGDGRVVFNYTQNDPPYYDFNTSLAGAGTIQHIAGETNLGGDNREFVGTVQVEGGGLYLQNTFGDEDGGDNASRFVVTGGALYIDMNAEASTAAVKVGADGTLEMLGWSTLNVTGSGGVTNAGSMSITDLNSAGTVKTLAGATLRIGGVSTLNAPEIINEGRMMVLSKSVSATVFGGRSDDKVINRGNGLLNIGSGWLNVTGSLENSSPGTEAGGEGGIEIATYGRADIDETLDNQTGGEIVNKGELRAKKIVNQAGAALTTSNLLSTSSSDGLTNDGTVNASGMLFGNMRNQGNGVFNVTGDLDSFDIASSATFTNDGNAVVNVTGGDFTGSWGLTNTSGATINIADGRTLGIRTALANAGTVVNYGIIDGGMTNEGTVTNAGTLKGGLVNDAGTFTNTGVVNDGVTINGGTFITHAAGQTADIVNNGALIFNQIANGTYAGLLTGTGTLEKQGTGTLELTADNSAFAGSTTLSSGKLVINNALGGTLNLAGGTLGGNGTLGTLIIGSGATLAPGNSIGTTNAVNYVFNAGSSYEVELNDGGNTPGVNNDFLNASGTVTITGAAIHVTPENGTDTGSTYTPGTVYTVVSATGGVAGTFNAITDDYAFLNFGLSYDANNVYLTSALGNLCLAGFTANQCAMADGIEALGSGALFTAITNLPNAAAAGAMDQLSGELYPSIATGLIEDSRFVRNAALDRMRSAFDGVGASDMSAYSFSDRALRRGLTLWGEAFGAFGRSAGDSNTAALDRSTGGFFSGADALVSDNVRLGALTGYSRTSFSVDGRASSGSADNWHLGIYSGGEWGGLNLRGGAAYSWHRIDTNRGVAFTGYSDSLSAAYNVGTAQAFGEAGYRIVTNVANFEPFAGIAYVHLSQDRFSEAGGAAALTSAQSDTDNAFSTLGLRSETQVALSETATVELTGGIGWRHAFGNITPDAVMALAGGSAFLVSGVPIARDAFVLELGANGTLSSSSVFGLSYLGQMARDANDHSFRANLAVGF